MRAMAISRTTIWIAGAVLVLPSLCFVGLALVGQAIENAQPGIARDPTPAEIAAREAERAAFRAMPPAEHLARARAALAQNHDPSTGRGGHIRAALTHLDAIAPDAGLDAEVAALREEIRGRRARLLTYGIVQLGAETAEAPPGAPGHSLRCAMFTRVRERTGYPVFSPGPPHDVVLVVHADGCDEATLRRVLAARETLRRMNFERVQCAHGGAALPVQEAR